MAISYDPKYIKPFTEARANGFSEQAAMAHFGGTRRQAYSWATSHPEWAEAKEVAAGLAVKYWEEKLHTAKGSESAPVIFALKNMGPDEWRADSKLDVNVSGAVEITKIERVVVDPKD